MAHMYVINPLSGIGSDNLFATHPSVENRIAALQQIASEMGTRQAPEPVHPDFAPRGQSGVWRVPQFSDSEEPPRKGPWG